MKLLVSLVLAIVSASSAGFAAESAPTKWTIEGVQREALVSSIDVGQDEAAGDFCLPWPRRERALRRTGHGIPEFLAGSNRRLPRSADTGFAA